MSIPLIQKPDKDDINTSIIAIKRNIERINMLLGLVDNDSPDLSGFATKQELQDAVTDLQPVDEVAVDNMHSVTSNAVANKCCRYIDYAHPIDLGTAQSWTATEDCYIEWFYMTSATNRELYINNNKVNVQDYYQTSNFTIYISIFSGYVKKGDVISSNMPWNSYIIKCFPLL